MDRTLSACRVAWVASLMAGAACGQPADANLIANAGFELVHKGKVLHWSISPGRAKAELAADDTTARSGKRCLRIANRAKRQPHVYSHITQLVDVLPNREYTLSCYVKSASAGAAWIGGGRRWEHRFAFPAKPEQWQRVVGTFKTAPDETSFRVMILTESPTQALWVDDVKLERGAQATAFVHEPILDPGQAHLTLTRGERRPNLIPNSSFEVVHGNRPEAWMFDKRNTDAAVVVDSTVARTGERSVRFTNGTRFGAHVYGWFGITAGIPVKPSTPYTMSAYVRSDRPGRAWIGGGHKWRLRCRFLPTAGQWQRVAKSYVTQPDETVMPLMIISESPTDGFWVDDVKLEEGAEATPYRNKALADAPAIDLALHLRAPMQSRHGMVRPYWAPSKYPPQECLFTNGPVRVQGHLHLPEAVAQARVRLRVVKPDGEPLAEATHAGELLAGAYRLDFRTHVGDSIAPTLTVTAELLDADREAARGRLALRVYTRRRILGQIAKAEASIPRLRRLVDALAPHQTDAYARATLTVLENFTRWAREDVEYQHMARAWDAAVIMEDMAQRRIREAEAVLAGERAGKVVPLYTTQPLRIDGPSFVADMMLDGPKAPPMPRPVFFVGYGHFSQVRKDVEKFPGYGCNMIQIEFGPRSVLPSEDEISDKAIEDFIAVCDRAAKANVSVNLLLSPHYFPGWALEKWPHLKGCSGGFFKYCVHAPEARAVIEKSLRRVIPRIKDLPALHSLCLSNEPISVAVHKCPHVRREWGQWLRQRHRTVAALNQRWRTEYKRFEDVPVPDEIGFPRGPMVYDFVRSNQELFAGFHQWMADVIHSMAPRVPVHAKIMMSAHFTRSLHGIWSVSPELFGQLSQINGNDLCCFVRRQGEWTSGWARASMALDFQRSMADLPVFNSETHLIVDRDHDPLPPEHMHGTLWQEAIHGQSASTIWVWNRTYSYTSSAAGAVIHRPACAEAVGRACLDLNRLARQVTAIQNVRPQVVVLWSLATVVHGDTDAYRDLVSAWEGLSFLGVHLGFVTERQLERYGAGQGTPLPLRSAKVIVAPQTRRLPEPALAGLRKFAGAGGRVVCLGQCFTHDAYDREHTSTPDFGPSLAIPAENRDLLPVLDECCDEWGVGRPVRVVDAQGGSVWGVETRCARYRTRWVANVVSHQRSPQTVRLTLKGKPARGTDLLTGTPVGPELVLRSQTPMLVQLDAGE